MFTFLVQNKFNLPIFVYVWGFAIKVSEEVFGGRGEGGAGFCLDWVVWDRKVE